jgi:hypothetical protein
VLVFGSGSAASDGESHSAACTACTGVPKLTVSPKVGTAMASAIRRFIVPRLVVGLRGFDLQRT